MDKELFRALMAVMDLYFYVTEKSKNKDPAMEECLNRMISDLITMKLES